MFKSLSSVGLTTLMSWAGFFSPPEPRVSFCEMEITHTSCPCCCYLVAQSCPTVTPWTVAPQAPLSMGFSKQEYWSGLSFSPPGDLPNPGIELVSPVSPALAGGFVTTELPGKSLSRARTEVQEERG